MLLLESGNRILESTILDRISLAASGEKLDHVEIMAADFNGVQFHVSTPTDNKSLLQVSIQTKCGAELLKYGNANLQSVYGSLLQATAEDGYDVTLHVDLSTATPDIAKKVSLLKRHLLAQPFLHVFDAIDKKAPLSEIITIPYRDQEAFYIKPEGDRVIVIFDIFFRDQDDVVFSKVFLQEFQDARRTIQNAPAVTFSQKEPPLELRGLKNIHSGESHGFVSFVLFQAHINAKNREKVIDLIQTFRDYLHYHIKCSKAYMHTMMRNRVDSLLQVLNRAKPEPIDSAKRTISGKTFKRQ